MENGLEKRPATIRTSNLPANILPLTATTQLQNTLSVRDTFPFKNFHSIPSLPTVLTNLALSGAAFVVAAASVFVTGVIFLPLGILKSTASTLLVLLNYTRRRFGEKLPDQTGKRRCVVINGASSGIGAALVSEYADSRTHLVLLARSIPRLKKVAATARALGATTSIHSLDYFESGNIDAMRQLLKDVDRELSGIDIAISCTGVTAHRQDVLGRKDPDKDNTDGLAPEIAETVRPMETGEQWGHTTAARMLRINVEAMQAFILTAWELMKARRLNLATTKSGDGIYNPKIVFMASSAAFFYPANFSLYSASKAYLYTLGQSLQTLSAPYGIQITTVCPGFIESGMTITMIEDGSPIPISVFGDPRKLAARIRTGEERNDRVVVYPLSQALPLYGCRALNPILEVLGQWVGLATGSAAWTPT
ncbi:hypothetical protein H2201_004015 [Coniosporium apollinis]|uniref:NAD(P)-binding protein n=1 Tax=Coniosporium apollinis TaxID=61459 RepID=A0ABQ9NW39_9PEZI|nr:hypothetical protein H2201_004015 [Coniosporium apollinis]